MAQESPPTQRGFLRVSNVSHSIDMVRGMQQREALGAEIGRFGERLAANYLIERGCAIVERNVFVDGDEIDLVMRDVGTLVAVEVKCSSSGYDPLEAVDDAKFSRIIRAVSGYRLPIGRIDLVGIAIDCSGVTVRWLRNVE